MLQVNDPCSLEPSESFSVYLMKGIYDVCRSSLVAYIRMHVGVGYWPPSALGRTRKGGAAQLIGASFI
jgi:hypothetical protein